MQEFSIFEKLFGVDARAAQYGPRPYQRRVAELLRARRNIVLSAPTGAGKTLAVLAPFLAFRSEIGARRLIYCLPMRTLAQGIHEEARRVAAVAGWRPDAVTLQTGDHPGDPYFNLGDIVVCTYDQFESGMLCGPYSLSASQHNINAGAAAGNLVVFDEFHLMDTERAFLTGLTCLQWFRGRCLSVWMTATATAPLAARLTRDLEATQVELSEEEKAAVERTRFIERAERDLTAGDVTAAPEGKTLAVVNTVKRSQELFEATAARSRELGIPAENVILLHSRFFARDKESKRKRLYELFGKDSRQEPAILIATQVVEAGLDISAERLLTDLCPMNALVQRCGRCARFGGEGRVTVFRGESYSPRPYEAGTVEVTWEELRGANRLITNDEAARWVGNVHGESDRAALSGNSAAPGRRKDAVVSGMLGTRRGGVGDLIRKDSDAVEILILGDPGGTRPAERETIGVWRGALRGLLAAHPGVGHQFDPEAPSLWSPLTNPGGAYIAALPPAVAAYSRAVGLRLGKAGSSESPRTTAARTKFDFEYRRETWAEHTERVIAAGAALVDEEFLEGGLMGDLTELRECVRLACLTHDIGKLQRDWQGWAERYEKARNACYEHLEPLAHTECRTDSDRALARAVGRKPPHSLASALAAAQVMTSSPHHQWAAVAAAVVSHHGGWFSAGAPPGEMDEMATAALGKFGLPGPRKKYGALDVDTVRGDVGGLIADTFDDIWPLASITCRLLRIADQKATREAPEIE